MQREPCGDEQRAGAAAQQPGERAGTPFRVLRAPAVADAADRFDAPSRGTELAADGQDRRVDRALADVAAALAVHFAQKGLAREAAVRVADERAKHRELGGRKVGRSAVDERAAGLRVQHERAALQHGGRGERGDGGEAEARADQQRERLRRAARGAVVGAGGERLAHGLGAQFAGERHERRVADAVPFAHRAEEGRRVGAERVQVHRRQIGPQSALQQRAGRGGVRHAHRGAAERDERGAHPVAPCGVGGGEQDGASLAFGKEEDGGIHGRGGGAAQRPPTRAE